MNAAPLTRATKLDLMMRSCREADGRFVTGVLTTRIFCRPSCRARKPLADNVVFFDGPEEARIAGFRPCKRCTPEAPGDPAREILDRIRVWYVDRLDGALRVEELAGHLGLTSRQLRRRVRQAAGCTPKTLLASLALARAVQLLSTTRATVLAIALEVGFGSLSAFQAAFRRHYSVSPLSVRREGSTHVDRHR
jgi:methylphosphotriester-DNA--protein-cysteine methyltransferase